MVLFDVETLNLPSSFHHSADKLSNNLYSELFIFDLFNFLVF